MVNTISKAAHKVGGKVRKSKKAAKSIKGKKVRKSMRKTMKKKRGGINMKKAFNKRLFPKEYEKEHCIKEVNDKYSTKCDVVNIYNKNCARHISQDKIRRNFLSKITGYTPALIKAHEITEEGEHCADIHEEKKQELSKEALKESEECDTKKEMEIKECKNN